MKRVISLILCIIMCFSVFSVTAVQSVAVGAADKIFSVKSGAVKDGKITYTVSLSGGVEGFGGAVIFIEYDNTVLAPAEEGFRPAYTSAGVQQFKGQYVSGAHIENDNMYSVAYMNTTAESVKANTEFFSITFDVINDARPKTSVAFYCKEFFCVTSEEQSITPADGLQTIAVISDINTLETPKLISADLKTNAIEFQWKSVVGATGYEIRRKTLIDTWTFVAKVSADELKYTDVNLESGTTYIYSVRAINSDGPGLYDATGVTCKYISKPGNVTAETGVGGVDVSWSATTGADKYKIMRREAGTEEWEVLEERPTNLVTNFKDTTVESGKTYEYDVNSVLGSFVTDTLSEGVFVTYLTSPVISSVKNIREGIELLWGNVENSAYYVIYRKAIGVETEFSAYSTVTSNSFVDYDVEPGKAYTYSVQAVSNYGNESAFTKTGYTITRVPSTIVTNVVPQADYITVYFQQVEGVDGYRIYRKTADSDWEKAGTTFSDASSFDDKLVPGGQVYYYCAVPYIGNSESDKVSTEQGVYFLKAPQNVKSVNTKDALKVTWDVVTGAGEYYVFRRVGETGAFTLVKTVKAGESLEYIDKDVEVDSIYYYTVQATSSKGQSFESEISPATMRITCVKKVEAKKVVDGVYIEWRNHKFAENYIICRMDGDKWERIGETAEVDYTDTTVESGKTYSYAVIPVVESFEGGIDEDEIVQIKYLAAPTITEATNYKSTVKIEWSKVEGAEKYRLQRVRLDSNWNSVGSYETIATTSELSFKDTDLVAGRRYSYRVYAIEGDEVSVASNPFKHIFLAVPKISSLKNAYGGIRVSWGAVKNAEKYRIIRKESGGEWETIKTVSSSTTAYTDKTTKNGVKYYYAVKALAGDSSSYYESKSFTYFGSPKVTVSNKTSAITVTWDKISGAKSYYVYRKDPGATSWKRIAIVTKNIYTDTNVKNGKTYKYTVKAYNGDIFSGYNTSGWTIKRLTAPKLNSISNKTNGVYLSWSKVTGASGYTVYRKTSTTSWTEVGKTKKGLSFTDKTAVAGKIYTYTVVARSGSSRSTYIADGLKMKRLERPALDSVKSAKKGITFSWEEVTGASGYLVYRKTGSGEWKQIAKVTGASTESYLDTTAKKGKTYYYSVRAYSGSYKSAYNTTGLKITDKY